MMNFHKNVGVKMIEVHGRMGEFCKGVRTGTLDRLMNIIILGSRGSSCSEFALE